MKKAVGSRQKASLTRIRAALQAASHHSHADWQGIRDRIAALTDQELTMALEFERLGARRTEHLKLLDGEIRRRRGDTGARKFRVEVGGLGR